MIIENIIVLYVVNVAVQSDDGDDQAFLGSTNKTYSASDKIDTDDTNDTDNASGTNDTDDTSGTNDTDDTSGTNDTNDTDFTISMTLGGTNDTDNTSGTNDTNDTDFMISMTLGSTSGETGRVLSDNTTTDNDEVDDSVFNEGEFLFLQFSGLCTWYVSQNLF